MQAPDSSIRRSCAERQTAPHAEPTEAESLSQRAAEGAANLEQFAAEMANYARDSLASHVAAVGRVLQYSGAQLMRDDSELALSRYAGSAGHRVERLADSIKERRLSEARESLESLARARPGLFVSGTLALGFAAARFLVSGASQPRNV